MFKIQKNKCIKKFNNLLELKINSSNNVYGGFVSFENVTSDNNNDKWLKNLSDVEIPENVKKVLILGSVVGLCRFWPLGRGGEAGGGGYHALARDWARG